MPTTPRALTATLLATLLLPGSTALAGEYRHIVMSPGLTLEGEVLETTSEGFLLAIPQGQFLVPFDKVEDLKNLASADVAQSPPWVVVLAGEGERAEAIRATLATVGGLDVVTPSAWDAAQGSSTSDCEVDLDCLAGAIAATSEPTEWIFAATVSPDEEGVAFRTQLVPTAETRSTNLSALQSAETWGMEAQRTLGLEPTPNADREFAAELADILKRFRTAPRDRNRAWTPRRVAALSFIPFPGVPSLMQKDYATFGGALGTAAAMTAGWVGATGMTSTSKVEHIAVGLAGAYVSTVASSQLFGHAALRRTAPMVALMPTFDDKQMDGLALTMTWTPRRAR